MVFLRGIKLTTALAAFALFFMPWLDIRCSGESLATQTGIQTITGKSSPTKETSKRQDPNREKTLGSAPLVGAALMATGLAVACLLVGLMNRKPFLDIAGSVLCGVALLCLLVQVTQDFPAKDALIEQVATDQASNSSDMGSMLAMKMMADLQVEVLPAFTITCVLLAIPALLGLVWIAAKIGAQKSGATSLLLMLTLGGCGHVDGQGPHDVQASRIKFVEKHGHAAAVASHPSDAIVRKLDSMIISRVNFEETTVEDAIEFLRQRSAELDPEEDHSKKGVCWVVRAPSGGGVANTVEDLEAALGGADAALAHADEDQARLTFRARNISTADLLVWICEEANLNCYLTSRGFLVIPEEQKFNVEYEKSVGIELWRVYREAK